MSAGQGNIPLKSVSLYCIANIEQFLPHKGRQNSMSKNRMDICVCRYLHIYAAMGDVEIKIHRGHVCMFTHLDTHMHIHTHTSHVHTCPLAVEAHTILHTNTQMHVQKYTAATVHIHLRCTYSYLHNTCVQMDSPMEMCFSPFSYKCHHGKLQ